MTVLKTVKADNEAVIAQQNEDITNLKREAQIKIRQLREVEGRLTKSLDDCDEFRNRVQNLSKDNTEMKLKIDVDKSTIDGLNSEMKHSDLELKESRDLCHVYE